MKNNVKTVEVSSNKKIIKKSKWQILMKVFANCCHQEPSRSFFIGKYQLPICARCLGTYLGYLIGIILNVCQLFMPFAFGFCLLSIMLCDWLLQNQVVYYSNNWIRFLTGIIGGIGFVYLISSFILIFI